jgi:F0F1-type ATP synthase membrane subunit a
MKLEPEVVFFVFGLQVTTTLVTTWGLVATLSAMAVFAGRRIQEHPARWQALAQYGLQTMRSMLDEVTGGSGSDIFHLSQPWPCSSYWQT